jgi:hypothetical protein
MSEVLAAWAGTGSAELSRRGEHAIAEICDQKVRDIARMLNHLAVTPASLRKMVPHSQWLDPTDPYLQLVAIAEANTARPRSSVSNEARAVDVSREVIANLDMVKLRLLTVEPLLHAEIDRVEAESAIRLAVVPPLLALTAVLVVRGSLWWLATLPLLLVVWHQGIQHRKTRGDRIADALTLGRVAAPYLERLLATASEAAAVAENPGRTSPPLV